MRLGWAAAVVFPAGFFLHDGGTSPVVWPTVSLKRSALPGLLCCGKAFGERRSQHISMASSTPGHDGLEQSGKTVERCYQTDSAFQPLLESLGVGPQSGPTVSGLNESAYPTLDGGPAGLAPLKQLNVLKRNPLPAELLEHFGHMQCNCLMGLFPEVGRAWLTIDSGIYVWAYEDGSDLAYFNGLSETILSVGLLSPKPRVFQSYIRYLLCLTTPVEIVLLGVTLSRPHGASAYEEMHLLPEPLFSLPTDGAYVVTIAGTASGRVFLGAKDGCLHELIYQAEDGWFSRKCRKVNHSKSALSFLVPAFISAAIYEEDPLVQIVVDDTRNVLYTRSEKGSLQVYDLGLDGQGISRVAALHQSQMMSHVSHVARTVDYSVFRPLSGISVVDRSESPHVHLVAITHTGARLYYTTTSISHPTHRPYTLQLLHVRLPPGFAANASPVRPSRVHMSHYRRGTLLLSSSVSEDNDALWVISNDPFPFQQSLMEMQSTLSVGGKTWAMAEVPQPSRTLEILAISQPSCTPPLALTQHAELPRLFVLLSAQGSVILTKMRPVDQLKQLLLDCGGPDSESVKAYFQMNGEAQACAMALVLACREGVQDAQMAEWARRAFFLHGGEPKVTHQQGFGAQPTQGYLHAASPVMNMASPNPGTYVQSPAGGFHPELVSTPVSAVQGMATPIGDIQFSGKHNGLYLHFSRIVRPFWYIKLVQPYQTQQKVQYLTSILSSSDMSLFLTQLHPLRDFVERNSELLMGGPGLVGGSTPGPNMDGSITGLYQGSVRDGWALSGANETSRMESRTEGRAQERQSLMNLKRLLGRTCQVLSFWKVLCDHQLHIILATLPKDRQQQVSAATFRDLVVSGSEVCAALVNSLISRFLDDSASTDAISERLREACPDIYRREDAACSKASELLLAARSPDLSQGERERLLREALNLAKPISGQLNLAPLCAQLAACRAHRGVVELCLSAAARRDSRSLALRFHKSGRPEADRQGYQAYLERKQCYQPVLDLLGALSSKAGTGHLRASVLPQVPGPPPPADPTQMAPSQAKEYAEQMFAMCLESDDELFHVSLYEWLVEQKMYEELLEIRHPFLEAFLQHTTQAMQEEGANRSVLDLLWKYYERNRNYLAAANILAKLAERHDPTVSLGHRLEYLSRAIMCLKSTDACLIPPTQGEFLHELEEKMEVARVQLLVLDTLKVAGIGYGSQQTFLEDAISRLNCDLLDITQLYEEYAQRFQLWECKLAILHCAGHFDAILVENVWSNIIQGELQRTMGEAPDIKIEAIQTKIKSLGKLYASSQKFFPLEYLVKHLEIISCKQMGPLQWVFSVMLEVGIPVQRLVHVYNRLSLANDLVWQSERQPLRLLEVLAELLDRFCDKPTLVPIVERQHFVISCQDMIARHLVTLDCRSDAGILTAKMRTIQDRLERLH